MGAVRKEFYSLHCESPLECWERETFVLCVSEYTSLSCIGKATYFRKHCRMQLHVTQRCSYASYTVVTHSIIAHCSVPTWELFDMASLIPRSLCLVFRAGFLSWIIQAESNTDGRFASWGRDGVRNWWLGLISFSQRGVSLSSGIVSSHSCEESSCSSKGTQQKTAHLLLDSAFLLHLNIVQVKVVLTGEVHPLCARMAPHYGMPLSSATRVYALPEPCVPFSA